jgi:hypothetical protein
MGRLISALENTPLSDMLAPDKTGKATDKWIAPIYNKAAELDVVSAIDEKAIAKKAAEKTQEIESGKTKADVGLEGGTSGAPELQTVASNKSTEPSLKSNTSGTDEGLSWKNPFGNVFKKGYARISRAGNYLQDKARDQNLSLTHLYHIQYDL